MATEREQEDLEQFYAAMGSMHSQARLRSDVRYCQECGKGEDCRTREFFSTVTEDDWLTGRALQELGEIHASDYDPDGLGTIICVRCQVFFPCPTMLMVDEFMNETTMLVDKVRDVDTIEF